MLVGRRRRCKPLRVPARGRPALESVRPGVPALTGTTMDGNSARSMALALACAAGAAGAADFGSYAYEDQRVALTHGCTVVPHFDSIGFGKPEVVVLLSDQPLDCEAYASWVIPGNGAHGDAVSRGNGGLLQLDIGPGPKLSRVTVSGVGYTLGNDSCEGCESQIAAGGQGITGKVATTNPLMDGKIAIDASFDLPRPAGPASGEALAGGGDPGKAWLAYLAAHVAGDYAALQQLMPAGEAEDDWGWYTGEAERSEAIKSAGSMQPKSAKIVQAWKIGNGALLVAEAESPHGDGSRYKAYASLGHDGKSWRVRESRLDWSSPVR